MSHTGPQIDRFAMIIGAMKCGTTSLFQYLSQHSQICPCSIKEPSFFSLDARFSKGLDWYKGLWNWEPGRHRVALEATTGYSRRPHFPNAAKRIAESRIRAKFIYIMRHPIERLQSNLRMNLAKGWKAFDEEGRIHQNLISNSLYYFQISEYFKWFPRENILLLRFEDFIRDPAAILQRICHFLEVDPRFPFCISREKVHDGTFYAIQSNPVVSSLILCGSKMRLTGLYSLLPKNAQRRIHMALSWFLAPMAGNAIRLTTLQKREILSVLGEDMRRLEEELGFDTTPWQLRFEDEALLHEERLEEGLT